ncbi:MAG TPA: VWA domain-containing protein [Pyrinomonadaceae bacterium]|nr:VWA domain-containing protein [Pyrinomonadaceae bacterium]
MCRSSLFCISTIVAVALFAIGAVAQNPTPTPGRIDDPNDVIKVSSRLIMVPASVSDASGNAVAGLTASDFKILEEGRQQTLENVSPGEKVPLEIALLFDVSASTDAMFDYELDTAARFLQGVMRPDDRASVFAIGASPLMVQSRDTVDRAAAAIKTLRPTKNYTAFYDTVRLAADYLIRNAPEHSRRVVLVISDGEDTNSTRVAKAIQDGYRKIDVNKIDDKTRYQLTVKSSLDASLAERQRVLQLLQNADTVFYSINPAGNSYQLNKISVFGQENMDKFAADTGGTAFVPRFKAMDAKLSYDKATNIRLNGEMLDQIFRQLANELRSQYLVQYYSETDYPNGRYVKLDVAVPTRPGVKIRARQGYYAKN